MFTGARFSGRRPQVASRGAMAMKPPIQQHTGRHFLQIPGPTNVPDRVLRAIDAPTIDHRGPEFAELGKTVFAGMKKVFKTDGAVVIYPASGTGAWEAALVNTLSPGDRVLMVETGHFASLWRQMATRLGLDIGGRVRFRPGIELAQRVEAASPTTKVLLMSGYVTAAVKTSGRPLLSKPFRTGDLLAAIRQMLDSRSAFRRPAPPSAPRPGFGPV